jgi:hypothetical protein
MVDTARISRIVSVQCQMTAPDEDKFAEDLGRVIGSRLGERAERRPF